ncbi:hypothetical protein [Salinisphaera sp. G21_0]|uniref:hypothetical protein n=1 Tax=Salinisphaera sp. G21_0 TaxID=2821094 RepID=UPI001ADB57A7|nr:hypothetical protein [Salinisphaera sp. G21_0]MBO9484692.1 hypothetical protein [Salinisphaera sp. G21_0]
MLASIAVFRELYDCNKDIYDVITNFIRSAIVLNSCWSLDTSKCSRLLRETYGFDLPEAVVKTCLKNRLKKNGELDIKDGQFVVTEHFNKTDTLIGHDEAVSDYDRILTDLIENIQKIRLSDESIDIEEVSKCFNEYIINPNYKNEYSNEISHFIISNQKNKEFNESLIKIEEGLILYTGIRFTAGINELGSWDNDLIIFLDTEILFSAAGLNGELYQKLFNDFNGLVDDANRSKQRNGKIQVCYFSEAEDEINSFFYAAERVFERNESIDPSKTAMHLILNGCKSRSDVATKKVAFYDTLKRLKISKKDHTNYYQHPEYNLESIDTINLLKDRFNNKDEDEEYSKILKTFTKINYIRKGESSVGIDKVKAILISAKRLTLNSAFSEVIRKDSRDIPFATYIDFMTERLWFKLNKGFGGDQGIPTSFKAVTKAQLALSSQISSQVTKEYKKLQSQLEKGLISRDIAIQINTELRIKPSKPEELNDNTVDIALEFLSSDLIEKTLREKSILETKSKEGEAANAQLLKLKNNEKNEAKEILRPQAKFKYYFTISVIYSVFPVAAALIAYFSKTAQDSNFALITGFCTLLAFFIQLISTKRINKFVCRQISRNYKIKLTSKFKAINKKYATGT